MLEGRGFMNSKLSLKYLVGVITFFLIIFLGYSLGKVVLNKDLEKYQEKDQTFIADITEIKSWKQIYVQGLKSNEKNFRKAYELKLNNQVKYTWQSEKISFDHVTTGDKIKITFKGDAGDVYPPLLDRVSEIELLSENKTRRMVKIDNKIYYDMNKENNLGRCGVFDGVFIKGVTRDEIPEINDTSNFGDYSYKKVDDKSIEVYIDGKWMIFTHN